MWNFSCANTQGHCPNKRVNAFLFFMLLWTAVLWAASASFAVPPGLGAGDTVRRYEKERNDREIETRFRGEDDNSMPSLYERPLSVLPWGAKKIFVKTIVIQADGYSSPQITKEIRSLAAARQGADLTKKEMEGLCREMGQMLEQDGIHVYLPRQNFTRKIMYINAVKTKKRK